MNVYFFRIFIFLSFIWSATACFRPDLPANIQTLESQHVPESGTIWLSHEHVLVDFIGADSIRPGRYQVDTVIQTIMPYLHEVAKHSVTYFVDATPNFLGRDPGLLAELGKLTGIRFLTNTGLYGARANKYIPAYAIESTPAELAQRWIAEFENGIDGSGLKPGFIKIGVDANELLDPIHQKLVKAAALTHLETGMTIASHTGEAKGLWPQLEILMNSGVDPGAFIWVHAQAEKDNRAYLKAAKMGCWISLDNFGWEQENNLQKLEYAREHSILDRILISHDAGWYDPAKKQQNIQPYTAIFDQVIPELKALGFTDNELDQLLKYNPAKAYSIHIRRLPLK